MSVFKKPILPPNNYPAEFDDMDLYNAFHNEVLHLVPKHQDAPHVGAININAKGSSTRKAQAPAIWFHKDVRDYYDRASAAIDDENIKRRLRRTYLPGPYFPCVLSTETDVVQATVLWLLHPVIKALQFLHPKVESAAEVIKHDSRCDALIRINNVPVAVIEYKTRGHLQRKEFESARLDFPSPDQADEMSKVIDKIAKPRSFQTLMEQNAAILTKQAAAYSFNWRTRFVALFDWDNLFLWHFDGLSWKMPPAPKGINQTRQVGHAQWARGTWVDQREHYRMALLGFVLEAWEDRQRWDFDVGQERPWSVGMAEQKRVQQQLATQRAAHQTPTQKAYQQLLRR